jgi:hypothetical protein
MMYDYAVLQLYCSLALTALNCHMPCASTEGQKIMKNAGKYLGSKKKTSWGKNYSTFPPHTTASKNCT